MGKSLTAVGAKRTEVKDMIPLLPQIDICERVKHKRDKPKANKYIQLCFLFLASIVKQGVYCSAWCVIFALS